VDAKESVNSGIIPAMNTFGEHIRNAKDALIERIPWQLFLVLGGIILLIAWWSLTPQGLLGKADAIGFAVCHRMDARSFHLQDRQIPVCARCTGQYLGAVLGIIYLSIFRPRRSGRPNWTVLGILIILMVSYVVDGINSYMHLFSGLSRFYLYNPNNMLRLFTGTGLGLGISVMLYPAFNDTVFKKRDPRPVVEGFVDISVLLSFAIGIDILVLTEHPLLLYPLALISAGGVMLILTIVYSMVIIMILKLENHFDNLSEMVYALLAGFMVALIQIAILDILRFAVTGSWSGFHIG
jgi:uncharacterized membrane protein